MKSMMSAEYPDIIPEPFGNPCASFEGNAENFINEVVKTCHSTLGVFFPKDSPCTKSFESNQLLRDYPATSQNCLQDPTNAHAHQHIRILVKEASEDSILDHNIAGINKTRRDHPVGKASSPKVPPCTVSLFANTTEEGATPTSIPGYEELVKAPLVAYPGAEEQAYAVRGEEVAESEEDCDSGLYKRTRKQHSLLSSPAAGCFGIPDSEAEGTSIHTNHFANLSTDQTQSSYSDILQSESMLTLQPMELRKLSDSTIHMRRQNIIKNNTSLERRRQRCLSDSAAPNLQFTQDEDEFKSVEGGSSALGCDSGFHERGYRFQEGTSPRISLFSSDNMSLEDKAEFAMGKKKTRRVTPHPVCLPSNDDSDDQSSVPTSANIGTMVHPRERSRRSLMKHFSQGSIGGLSVSGGSVGGASSAGASSESPTLSSVLESQSNMTVATDILSSLGFDDFDSPQLVPDRFIPKDLEYLKPSVMKTACFEQYTAQEPPRSPDSLASGQSSSIVGSSSAQRSVDHHDLPLGATAETYIAPHPRPSSPVSVNILKDDIMPLSPGTPTNGVPLFLDTVGVTGFSRSRVLETVPEETASDLSPSPRWLSPRVSVDHSVLDLTDGKLGASLVKVRKRSLPSGREGYRISIGSLVESDTGDSIHLSVTSYDDEIAAERERERENLNLGVAVDDTSVGCGRRRKRGVYTPPQALLSWLSTQKPISEEDDTDPDELPWPFNEQARLRKSLSEISLARNSTADNPCSAPDQSSSSGENALGLHERSESPLSPRFSPQSISSEEDEDASDSDYLGNKALEQSDVCADEMTFLKSSNSEPVQSPLTTQPISLPSGSLSFELYDTDSVKLTALSTPEHLGSVSPMESKPTDYLDSKLCCGEPTMSQNECSAYVSSNLCENRSSTVVDQIDVSTGDRASEVPQARRKNEKDATVMGTHAAVGGILDDSQSSKSHNTEAQIQDCTCEDDDVTAAADLSFTMDSKCMTEVWPTCPSEAPSSLASSCPRTKPCLTRQKSFEESPKVRRRSSRKLAVFGEVPAIRDLFPNSDDPIAESQKEFGKVMVL